MQTDPSGVSLVRSVAEIPRRPVRESGVETPSPPSLLWWVHPEWEGRFPWLAQGTTGRIPEDGSGDFALFREVGAPAPREIWEDLAGGLGFPGVAHARQIHGRTILLHSEEYRGLTLGEAADGHVTSVPGTLMAVTVADCVPVFLVDSVKKSAGLLHAGWRGTVDGILEEGVARMRDQMGARVEDLFLHLGPAICGGCYEVGPEVHERLGLPVPQGPSPVELRGLQVERAIRAGLRPGQVSRSSHCTRCAGSSFFSHRGGDPERQVGFLGNRHTSTTPFQHPVE